MMRWQPLFVGSLSERTRYRLFCEVSKWVSESGLPNPRQGVCCDVSLTNQNNSGYGRPGQTRLVYANMYVPQCWFSFNTIDFIEIRHFPYRNIVQKFEISNNRKPIQIIFPLFAKFYRMISLKINHLIICQFIFVKENQYHLSRELPSLISHH